MEMLIEIKKKDRRHTLDFMKNRVYSSYTLVCIEQTKGAI